MIKNAYTTIERYAENLNLGLTAADFALLAEENDFSDEAIRSICLMLERLSQRKTEATIRTLLKTSRLPMKAPKTFENFDFSVIKGKDVDKLRNLTTLSAIYAHKNLAFIGPAGTGKTHLAQAFGYECCKQGMKVYFIKMSELRDKFTAARKAGTQAAAVRGLVIPSCLIIDEVGHCEFDKENTRLFFDLIDRRYNKEGNYNIVFTSNKNPAQWRENFNEDDALLCALDRIFDDATVFNIKGDSYRGKSLETIALHAGRLKAPKSSEAPTI